MIEGLQHFCINHPLDEIVGGNDHIICAPAILQFGEQFIVGRIDAEVDTDILRTLEIFERRFTDISVPIVEGEFGLFARARVRAAPRQ